jgi:hypothetical protein
LVALVIPSKLNPQSFSSSFFPFSNKILFNVFFRWYYIFVQRNLLLKYRSLFNWWMQTRSIWVMGCGMLTFFFFFHKWIISLISLSYLILFMKFHISLKRFLTHFIILTDQIWLNLIMHVDCWISIIIRLTSEFGEHSLSLLTQWIIPSIHRILVFFVRTYTLS